MFNSYNYQYLPVPPKAWYRVENRCTFDISYNDGYDPLIYNRAAQINKGNVLQYKKNSTHLTKNQKYSQIAKGLWTNRTKTWATQSDVYTNPNMLSLKRVGFVEYPKNDISPSSPANIGGPFVPVSSINDPFNCPNFTFKDGGTLICGVYQDPCTGTVIERTFQPNYYPTSDSDVPGKIELLYWDPRLQSWYPKVRRTMNNSTDKWPVNYKLFTSAIKPNAPVLSINAYTTNTVSLSWTVRKSNCIPISNYNIYDINNNLIKVVDYKINNYTIDNLTSGKYGFYIIAFSTKYKSESSNIVTIELA